jgi:hypothetical protein
LALIRPATADPPWWALIAVAYGAESRLRAGDTHGRDGGRIRWVNGMHLWQQAGKAFLAAFGLFGTLFGIYSYYDIRVVRTISYDVAGNVKVFDKNFSSSNIVIKTRDGKDISRSVYKAEIIIWSSVNNIYQWREHQS